MNKKILITGGPSWVKLDAIRIITNVFTGSTSVLLAREFAKEGHQVTLLVNPQRAEGLRKLKGVNVVYFFWFHEFLDKIKAILKSNTFDCIVHTAALSDFLPERKIYGKISSRSKYTIKLVPAQKALKIMRRLHKNIIVQFKLEAGKTKEALVKDAYKSLMENKSDFVIANDYKDIARNKFRRYLISRDKSIVSISSNERLPSVLLKHVLL